MIDRRWERLHVNGWRSVVVQGHPDWYTGFAEPPKGAAPTPAAQHHELDECQTAADASVAPHRCKCGDWREVFLPHVLGSRLTEPT
jgi:hypothetical protein